MSYPEKAEVNGKVYDLNTSYKNGIRCIEIINDNTIGDTERTLAVIKRVFGFVPERDVEAFLDKAILFLRCGKEPSDEPEERYFDHSCDESYVKASFQSDYHIDLDKEDMHWWKYNDLLNGVTKDSVISRVIEIRNYDVSEVKDAKSRADILRAKESVALPVLETEEEREMREAFERNFE